MTENGSACPMWCCLRLPFAEKTDPSPTRKRKVQRVRKAVSSPGEATEEDWEDHLTTPFIPAMGKPHGL